MLRLHRRSRVLTGRHVLTLWLPTVVLLSAASRTIAQPSAQPHQEWRAFGHDPKGTKYSPLDQINRDNVKNLKIVWRQSATPDALKEGRSEVPPPPNNYQHTPIMIDGLVYLSSGFGGAVVALDASTGKVVWTDRPAIADPRGGPSRSLAHWTDGRDHRIIAVTGQYLVALDARTGERYPNFGEGGRVDLVKGYDKPVEAFTWRTGPSIVVRDVIIVGSYIDDVLSAARPVKRDMPPGDVRGIDVRTGKQLWIWHSVPRPGEFGNETWEKDSWAYTGNTNVWGPMSADEELGHVYLPLSTPTNDFYGGHRPGANLFADSIVALDAKTGRRVWHFQAVHHGLWDYDFPCPPVLVDIVAGGRRIKALAQPSKQAFLYVLDRETGKPVWPIVERPVPQSTAPGEQSSPTQPIPLDARGRPFAYDQQGVAIDDLIDFTPELRREAVEIVREYAFGPVFYPIVMPGVGAGIGKKGSIQMPGSFGGTSWMGAGLDPETNVLYVPSSQAAILTKLVKAPPGSTMDYVREGLELAKGPRGLPLFKPPYGRLVAVDLNKGEIKWILANGDGPRDHEAIRHLNLPPLGTAGRVGPLVTKTLVFLGEGYFSSPVGGGKKFRAYDKTTGRVVWETELEGGNTSPPITYLWQGKQYIVVPMGWPNRPGELVALGLN